MTQELIRDDSLPYREFVMRPGEQLDYAFEWSGFLASRWFKASPYSAAAKIRPLRSTGFQYVVSQAGMTGFNEPAWPTRLGDTVLDGSVVWKAQAIDSTSLTTSINASSWTSDSPVTVPTTSLTGTNATGFVMVPSNASDGDYFVRNTVTLADGRAKIGVLLIRVRAGKV